MSVQFTVPNSWRSLDDLSEMSCDAATVGDALTWFAERYPTLRERILTDAGDIASWCLVVLDRTDVRTIGKLRAPISVGDHEIEIISALMGG